MLKSDDIEAAVEASIITRAQADTDIRQLGPDDAGGNGLFRQLMDLFGKAFEDTETYGGAEPSETYARELLGREDFIALVAIRDGAVVGGLTAYVLRKPEQERSECYIYDLAVDASHRRRGIATGLIDALKPIAKARGAYVIFVQADLADATPIALYSKLGRREDVLHFDIPVD